jgi:hypothetical protein
VTKRTAKVGENGRVSRGFVEAASVKVVRCDAIAYDRFSDMTDVDGMERNEGEEEEDDDIIDDIDDDIGGGGDAVPRWHLRRLDDDDDDLPVDVARSAYVESVSWAIGIDNRAVCDRDSPDDDDDDLHRRGDAMNDVDDDDNDVDDGEDDSRSLRAGLDRDDVPRDCDCNDDTNDEITYDVANNSVAIMLTITR